ncbi:MAG TPA: hypothetical protein VGH63_07120, partial [Polyangia bacterium]
GAGGATSDDAGGLAADDAGSDVDGGSELVFPRLASYFIETYVDDASRAVMRLHRPSPAVGLL